MKGLLTPFACAVLWAAFGTAGAASPHAPVDDGVAADPGAAWERFLAEADLETSYPSFETVKQVGYGAGNVDPEGCRTHAEALDEAVSRLPVSIAIRHAAMLCAGETGDAATADRELAAVAALSRHALAQAYPTSLGAPIRFVAPADAYALLQASGLEFRYEFFEILHPARYFPLHVAAWDPEAGQERHLRFDFVDSANAILRKDVYSGFPFQRKALANQFIEGLAGAGELSAIDYRTMLEAAKTGSPQDKRTLLVPIAARGGIQSTLTWLVLCGLKPFDGCGDGFVETVLPHAEEKHALPMVLLAVAHGEGIGVEPDPEMAERLLDAADAQWPMHGGTVAYATIWSAMRDDPMPARLQARLDRAWRAGNPEARLVALEHAAGLENAVLDDAALADLARPALNSIGQGHAVLARYYEARKDKVRALESVRRASGAGDAWNQAMLASHLRYEQEGDPADPAEVERLLVDAAHGGDGWAARRLAFDSMDDGRWVDAKAWLLDPAGRGDVEAILAYAELHEVDRPGVPANMAHAVELYRSLADSSNVAEARRRLAGLAMEGRGMDQDLEQAREWLLADAEGGDHDSQAMLGLALLNGRLGDVDETEAMRWLEPAIEAKHDGAMVDYANWLYYTRDTPASRSRARDLWQLGDDEGFVMASNNLAWALCTAREQAERDPARGLRIALKMDEGHDLGSSQVDTVAACHAANGDFASAAREQQAALDELGGFAAGVLDDASSADVEDTMQGFRERLALYREGKPYVEEERQ